VRKPVTGRVYMDCFGKQRGGPGQRSSLCLRLYEPSIPQRSKPRGTVCQRAGMKKRKFTRPTELGDPLREKVRSDCCRRVERPRKDIVWKVPKEEGNLGGRERGTVNVTRNSCPENGKPVAVPRAGQPETEFLGHQHQEWRKKRACHRSKTGNFVSVGAERTQSRRSERGNLQVRPG